MASATFAMKNVKVKSFGTEVNVPDNAMAKLMYYLHCVATVIDYPDRDLIDYQNYDELSGEELVKVYEVAKELHPKLFIDAGIFIVNPNLITNDLDNQFFEINDETIGVHVNEEIGIGKVEVKVLKVMVCNNNWLYTFYDTPIEIIDRIKRDIELRLFQQQVVPTETSIKPEERVVVVNVEYGRNPVTTGCPYCQNIVTTKIKSKFNCLALCCCLIFDIFYCCYQAIANKNICCRDIAHVCPICGATLGYIKSC